MKKIFSLVYLLGITNSAWAACSLTTRTLSRGSDATYDEYLYTDSKYSEMRQEGATVQAYLCGDSASGCSVGTKMRLRGAVVGNGTPMADGVYECKNTSSGGRSSYQWVYNQVMPSCSVNNKNDAQYDYILNLHVYNGKYCVEVTVPTKNVNIVDNRTNFNDVVVAAYKHINSVTQSGTELIIGLDNGVTQRFRIGTDAAVKMYDTTARTWVDMNSQVINGAVRITDITGKHFNNAFEIATDGTVKLYDASMKMISSVTSSVVAAYMKTLDVFADVTKTAIKESNQTIRQLSSDVSSTAKAWSNDIKDTSVAAIDGGIKITEKLTDGGVQSIQIATDGTVKIMDSAGKVIKGTTQTLADGTIKIIDSTNQAVVSSLQIMADGTVKVLDSTNKMLTSVSQNATDAYKATLGFFDKRASEFNSTVQTTIKESNQTIRQLSGDLASVSKDVTQMHKDALDTTADISKTAITSSVGLAEKLLNPAATFADAYGRHKGNKELQNLKARIAKCTTQEQVAEMIDKAMREAKLSNAQREEVKHMIDEAMAELGEEVNIISGRLDVLEAKFVEMQNQVSDVISAHNSFAKQTDAKIKSTNTKLNRLAAEVKTKTTAEEVVQLISENTQEFTDGQLEQLNNILFEYTKVLSGGQKEQVQNMIKEYVDPQVRALKRETARLNQELEKESQRRVAMDKLASAMSSLNAFMSGADVSVWKTADGKFNGARLASDATAGVVLGTAGGLLSNSLIKKSQVKKGFEGISCRVAGQDVAEYGDEFVIGR